MNRQLRKRHNDIVLLFTITNQIRSNTILLHCAVCTLRRKWKCAGEEKLNAATAEYMLDAAWWQIDWLSSLFLHDRKSVRQCLKHKNVREIMKFFRCMRRSRHFRVSRVVLAKVSVLPRLIYGFQESGRSRLGSSASSFATASEFSPYFILSP